MTHRERSYRCNVCRWQGTLYPMNVGEAAACPNCGVYLYPQSWVATWGLALVMIAASLGFVAAAVFLLK